uniref:Uncharacterized protein n=1 Tax=Anguilla anguilla TaxID=7936 RepID=A0A0E9UBY0_ANGAN
MYTISGQRPFQFHSHKSNHWLNLMVTQLKRRPAMISLQVNRTADTNRAMLQHLYLCPISRTLVG